MRNETLLADIGGTNARFAFCEPDGSIRDAKVLPCAAYNCATDAALDYLWQTGAVEGTSQAAFCVAGPVEDQAIRMTNLNWDVSAEEIKTKLNADQLVLLNDFEAIALGVPELMPEHKKAIGGGEAVANRSIAVVGPGTGLGVSYLTPAGKSWEAHAAEGGHTTMAPRSDREGKVLADMRKHSDHISVERVVSGAGLFNIYHALCSIEGITPEKLSPPEIAQRGQTAECKLCTDALDMFADFLGTVVSDLALTLGAKGGVYLAGGMLPVMGEAFRSNRFRARFEDKGRFSDYLKEIPTFLITHPEPAFLGLARALGIENPKLI